MSIIWLASYPKSGNTWLRFLLYNYLFGEVRRSGDIARRIPDIHTLTTLDTTTHNLCYASHTSCIHSGIPI